MVKPESRRKAMEDLRNSGRLEEFDEAYMGEYGKNAKGSKEYEIAKQQFIDWLKESIPQKIEYGISFGVATGVYGHVVPVSHGYSSMPGDERYLVILSIRSVKLFFSKYNVNTDLDRLNELN